ncbi:hypothetical protein [Nostoc sp. C117]|uniref:hypothetical protein n=1 Tax=Nostoc sp. C117 TaxID=3349875 RepID=UPI00370D90ED
MMQLPVKKILTNLLLSSTTFIVLGVASAVKAETFSAADDFSATNNPNGVWTYGYASDFQNTKPLGSNSFFVYNFPYQLCNIDAWSNSSILNPSVSHNGTLTPLSCSNMTFPPGQLAFHPGPNREYSFVRWTAPQTTQSINYYINVTFTGLDPHPTTTDVHIVHYGASLPSTGEQLFTYSINGYSRNSGKSFSQVLLISPGDIIDFVVGAGDDGTYDYDTTGLDAIISTVNPFVVTSTNDDGSAKQIGTLSYALKHATIGGSITFALPTGNTVYVTNQLPPVPTQVTIDGGACTSGPAITIDGSQIQNTSAPGLVLSGQDTLHSLKVTHFPNQQITNTGGGNKLSCVQAVK